MTENQKKSQNIQLDAQFECPSTAVTQVPSLNQSIKKFVAESAFQIKIINATSDDDDDDPIQLADLDSPLVAGSNSATFSSSSPLHPTPTLNLAKEDSKQMKYQDLADYEDDEGFEPQPLPNKLQSQFIDQIQDGDTNPQIGLISDHFICQNSQAKEEQSDSVTPMKAFQKIKSSTIMASATGNFQSPHGEIQTPFMKNRKDSQDDDQDDGKDQCPTYKETKKPQFQLRQDAKYQNFTKMSKKKKVDDDDDDADNEKDQTAQKHLELLKNEKEKNKANKKRKKRNKKKKNRGDFTVGHSTGRDDNQNKNRQNFQLGRQETISQKSPKLQINKQRIEKILKEHAEYEQDDSSEDEGIPDYKIGGYHPVHIGQLLHSRYIILQKLGWGHFSTVWLCKDIYYNSYVAIKVQRSAPHYLEAAYDQVEILEKVARSWEKPSWKKSFRKYSENGIGGQNRDELEAMKKRDVDSNSTHCVQLLNSFLHHGPNGKHFVMVFEILGVNLLEIIKRYNYKGTPLQIVRVISKQVLIGLDYLHRMCKIIHTDLKPQNVLLSLSKQEIEQIATRGQLTMSKIYQQINIVPIENISGKISAASPSYKSTTVSNNSGNRCQDRRVEGQQNNSSRLTKNQKKKLKRKQKKKNIQKEGEESQIGADELSQGQDSLRNSTIGVVGVATNMVKSGAVPLIPLGEKNDSSAAAGAMTTRTANKQDTCSLFESKKSQEPSQAQQQQNKDPSKDISRAKSSIAKTTPTQQHKLSSPQTQAKKQSMESPQNAQSEAPANQDDRGARRGGKIDQGVRIKVADLGNGCWTFHHFSTEIQTRQYRSPEVIIGAHYDTSADIWSLACMIFELITGDFLFEPRKGQCYDKDDDHLAQMMELLGPMPKNFALSGSHSKRFFSKDGKLRKIRGLNYWPLQRVLKQKYKMIGSQAKALTNFLRPMLHWYPEKRATAQQMLSNAWLSMIISKNCFMTDREHRNMMLRQQLDPKSVPIDQDDPHAPQTTDNMSELADSDYEKFDADLQDNDDVQNLFDDIAAGYGMLKGYESEDLWNEEQNKKALKILRGRTIKRKPKCSYAAGNSYYNFGQHLDLKGTDKGANPQFRELDVNLDI